MIQILITCIGGHDPDSGKMGLPEIGGHDRMMPRFDFMHGNT